MSARARAAESAVDAAAELTEREAIRDVIQETAARLDAEELDRWIALFADGAEYEITTYAPEIRTQMSWWKSGRDDLARILREVPEHVRDPGCRRHVVAPVSVAVDGDRAAVLSHFSVFRTDQDGHSAVYAVGRYEDTFVKRDGGWLYERHRVVLDTRMLEAFTHLPL